MDKDEKIRKNSQFRYIYNHGKSCSNSCLVLYYFRNRKNIDISRLGISVSKKVGNSVVRNRIRRLIKENYRLNKHNFKTGYDIIFIARVRASKSDYYEIKTSIDNLMRKCSLINEDLNNNI